MTFTFKIKYLFNKNIVRTNIKKYKRLPCHVLIRSNFLNRKSFPSFFKIFLSLTAKSNHVFFFNTKHSSNLINIDLIKGYSGLIFLLLFSIEFIIRSGIFEMHDNSLIVRFCCILASFTNFAISIYWSTIPEVKSLFFSDFLLSKFDLIDTWHGSLLYFFILVLSIFILRRSFVLNVDLIEVNIEEKIINKFYFEFSQNYYLAH